MGRAPAGGKRLRTPKRHLWQRVAAKARVGPAFAGSVDAVTRSCWHNAARRTQSKPASTFNNVSGESVKALAVATSVSKVQGLQHSGCTNFGCTAVSKSVVGISQRIQGCSGQKHALRSFSGHPDEAEKRGGEVGHDGRIREGVRLKPFAADSGRLVRSRSLPTPTGEQESDRDGLQSAKTPSADGIGLVVQRYWETKRNLGRSSLSCRRV